jgi:hypothetical protein
MIVYIHGASATAESFNYIRQFVRDNIEEPDISFEYDSADGFEHNLNNMKGKLDDAERLFFISHSLGGIYSLHLANYYNETTVGGISLSTPYGGCVQADYAKYFLPFSRLMRDIGTMSKPMKDVKTLPKPPHWTQVVSTRGDSPWIHEQNDGVVTLDSMRFRKDFDMVEFPINHYEVVLNSKVVELILDKIREVL